MVLFTAQGRWGKPVPHGHLEQGYCNIPGISILCVASRCVLEDMTWLSLGK